MQYPKRRETEEQAKERIEKLKENNAKLKRNEHGQPVDTVGRVLKNLKPNELFKL